MGKIAFPLIVGFVAGIVTLSIILALSQAYHDSHHFQFHYTGLPDNPTCHMIGQDLWDCEHLR